MLKEYVVKVGGMFLEHQSYYNDECRLTPTQQKATRFEEKGLEKVLRWMQLYELPVRVFRVTGQFTQVDLQQEVDRIAADAAEKKVDA